MDYYLKNHIVQSTLALYYAKYMQLEFYVYTVKLYALANATKSPNWWKGLGNSLIHINTPTHMWRIKGEEQLRPGREPAK
jgi:hypothetical protein